MRRISVLLACAAIVLAAVVAWTYYRSLRRGSRDQKAPGQIANNTDAMATAWHWQKDDPQTNCPVVRLDSRTFRAIHDPQLFQLQDVKLRLYNKGCSSFTYVQSRKAQFDTWTGVLTSEGEVSMLMSVPTDKSPDDPAATSKLVRVQAKGVTYETKTGKVMTNQPAVFQFAQGHGSSVGAEYDPNTHLLAMKSQVSVDWFGNGPAANAMHIEAGRLVYEENQGKIHLSPWSKLKRASTTITGGNSEIMLMDHVLHQVDTVNATGTAEEPARHVDYGADKLTALFDDNGVMTQMTATDHARLTSTDAGTRTTVNANVAELHFDLTGQMVNGEQRQSSVLREVFAKGNGVVESAPVARPNVQLADTRILKSDAIELMMRPGGQEIESMRTDAPGQLEFKPNSPGKPHRTLDANRIQIAYGDNNALQSFRGTQAKTRTDKPPAGQTTDGKQPVPPPSFTWSDELIAKFSPDGNQLSTLEQKGNFRYEEGLRHATATKAFLEQAENRITLTDKAKVWDNTGTTLGDVIVLNQKNGDMDATGHVASTREPESSKQGQNSTMLDESKPMQARSDKMQTRDNNFQIVYEGHAVLWQGANRISANRVEIDRDKETLHAMGNVVSELLDRHGQETPMKSAGVQPKLEPVVDKTPTKGDKTRPENPGVPVFTIVHAPELVYSDEDRLAHYTGGVKLIRDHMTVTSEELRAFLTPNDPKSKDNDTSLDHAFADGDVVVYQANPDRTRTGTSQHCEYYPKQNKVILNGGMAKVVDSRKGTTVGRQLTYLSDTDETIVEGGKNAPVVSDMMRH
jgi:lipopolysaccharide export system protein LptA